MGFAEKRATMGAAKQLRLLGGFQVRVEDRQIPLPATSAKLLALVAIHQRGMTRARVAGTFWGELNDQRALANLRAMMWRLPAPVQPMLATTSTAVALAEDVDVDLHVTRRVVREVLDHDLEVATGSGTIELLCKPLLPEWDEDWLVFERERLRQLHIHALERLGQRHIERGDPLSGVDVGVAVIGCEPLRESAHALLIRAHLAAGNRYEARRCYQRYRDLLWHELRLDPSPEMVDHVALGTA